MALMMATSFLLTHSQRSTASSETVLDEAATSVNGIQSQLLSSVFLTFWWPIGKCVGCLEGGYACQVCARFVLWAVPAALPMERAPTHRRSRNTPQ